MATVSRRKLIAAAVPALVISGVGLGGCGGVSDEERAWALSYEEELLQQPHVVDARVDLTRQSGQRARLTIVVTLDPELGREDLITEAENFRVRFAELPVPTTLREPYVQCEITQHVNATELTLSYEDATAETVPAVVGVALDELEHGANRAGAVGDFVNASWNRVEEEALLRPIDADHVDAVSRTAGTRTPVSVTARSGKGMPDVPLAAVAAALTPIASIVDLNGGYDEVPISWSVGCRDIVARDAQLADSVTEALGVLTQAVPPVQEFTINEPWYVTLSVTDQVTVSNWGSGTDDVSKTARENIVAAVLERVNAG